MTGIPLTEQALIKNRPGYSDYIKRTSAFLPWRPAKEDK
jgi:steroid 5-alpha reductase family enzyme